MASLLVACSSESSHDPRVLEMHMRGGSRLRPVVWQSDDGLQLSVGMYDRRLEVPCEPRLAVDGIVRCLPAAHYLSAADRRYADANCTRPILSFRFPYRHLPGYLLQFVDAGDCSGKTRVVRTRTVDEVYVYAREGCVRDPDISGEEILREVPAADFAELAVASGPRIRSATYDGKDGSRITVAGEPLWDGMLGASCSPALANDGRERCLPDPTMAFVGFAEGTCADHAFARAACAEHPFLHKVASVTKRAAVYGAGEPLTTIFERNESACATKPVARDAFRLGPEIEPSSFVAVGHATFGGTRLRAQALELEGRLYPETHRLHDAQLGDDCWLAAASKDTFRCLPSTSSESVVYLDDKCTRPAVEYDGTFPRWAYDSGRDHYVNAVYAVQPAEPKDAEVYSRMFGSCSPLGRKQVVPVGFTVPLSAFPEVKRIIR